MRASPPLPYCFLHCWYSSNSSVSGWTRANSFIWPRPPVRSRKVFWCGRSCSAVRSRPSSGVPSGRIHMSLEPFGPVNIPLSLAGLAAGGRSPVDHAGHRAARLYLPSCGRFSSRLYLRVIRQLWGVCSADMVKLGSKRSLFHATLHLKCTIQVTFYSVRACHVSAVSASTGHDGQLSHNGSISCFCTVAADPAIDKQSPGNHMHPPWLHHANGKDVLLKGCTPAIVRKYTLFVM